MRGDSLLSVLGTSQRRVLSRASVESLVLEGAGGATVNGIAAQGRALTIRNVTVTNVTAGVSGGYFCQFLPADSAEAVDAACDLDGWCRARTVGLHASSVTDCEVHSALQGVTVIGSDCVVAHNRIALSTKTWTSPDRSFGIGMGVSAVRSQVSLLTESVTSGWCS